MSALALQTRPEAQPGFANKPDAANQYLIFSLCGEQFAVCTLRVREIIAFGDITPVPSVPDFIRGVINLRGAMVPVIDLNVRFERAETTVSRRSCLIVLEFQNDADTHALSIIADVVKGVRYIDRAHVEPSPSFGTHIRADFMDGMAEINDDLVILLNLGKVLPIGDIAMIKGLAANGMPSAEG